MDAVSVTTAGTVIRPPYVQQLFTSMVEGAAQQRRPIQT